MTGQPTYRRTTTADMTAQLRWENRALAVVPEDLYAAVRAVAAYGRVLHLAGQGPSLVVAERPSDLPVEGRQIDALARVGVLQVIRWGKGQVVLRLAVLAVSGASAKAVDSRRHVAAA